MIRIDNRVRIPGGIVRGLPAETLEALKAICTHPNPLRKKYRLRKWGRRPSETVHTWEREYGGEISFPAGREEQLLGILGEVEIEYRTSSVPVPTREWTGPEPWDFQRRLVESYLNGGAWIWRAPPGSGKTVTVMQLFARLGQKMLVVAPTDAVFSQWVRWARELFGFEPGIIKGQVFDIEPDLVIGSQRSLMACAGDLAGAFGIVVVDECQKAAAASYQEIIDVLRPYYRLAVSGDEHRADGMEHLIYDQFGPDVEEVPREELIEKGTLVDVEVEVLLSSFQADWYKDVEEKPGETAKQHAARLMEHRFLGRHRLMDEMAASHERNELIRDAAMRCLAEGEQVIVLSRVRDHCVRLEAMFEAVGVRTVRLMGDDRDFEDQRARFAAGEAQVAVGTYGKVGVGFESHREVARGIIGLPVASQKEGKMQARQFAGRFARAAPGKQRAVLFYIHDPLVFGDKPVKLLASWFRKVFVNDGRGNMPAALWLQRKRRKQSAKSSRSNPATTATAPSNSAPTGQRRFWDD